MAKQRLIPSGKVKLADYQPDFTDGWAQDEAKAEKSRLDKRLTELQNMLYAQAEHSLLIVLQAMDAGGKDGTIKKVFDAVNPQGVVVTSFKQPSDVDLAHDFLWRVHQHTPAKGYISIFNRSHYEDVLIVRVNNLVPRDVWEKRYDHINNFERLLAESGTRIVKFFLHISKDEQRRRFEARLEQPHKRWKFSLGDLPVREQWDDYMEAYEAVLERTNTEYAPWYVIPANHKWYRNLVISRVIVETLDSMNLKYPEPADNLDDVKIPD